MKKLILSIVAALSVALLGTSCNSTGGGALVGAGVGAASGAILGNNVKGISKGEGALIGAGVGAVSGAVIGNKNQKTNQRISDLERQQGNGYNNGYNNNRYNNNGYNGGGRY